MTSYAYQYSSASLVAKSILSMYRPQEPKKDARRDANVGFGVLGVAGFFYFIVAYGGVWIGLPHEAFWLPHPLALFGLALLFPPWYQKTRWAFRIASALTLAIFLI